MAAARVACGITTSTAEDFCATEGVTGTSTCWVGKEAAGAQPIGNAMPIGQLGVESSCTGALSGECPGMPC